MMIIIIIINIIKMAIGYYHFHQVCLRKKEKKIEKEESTEHIMPIFQNLFLITTKQKNDHHNEHFRKLSLIY